MLPPATGPRGRLTDDTVGAEEAEAVREWTTPPCVAVGTHPDIDDVPGAWAGVTAVILVSDTTVNDAGRRTRVRTPRSAHR